MNFDIGHFYGNISRRPNLVETGQQCWGNLLEDLSTYVLLSVEWVNEINNWGWDFRLFRRKLPIRFVMSVRGSARNSASPTGGFS